MFKVSLKRDLSIGQSLLDDVFTKSFGRFTFDENGEIIPFREQMSEDHFDIPNEENPRDRRLNTDAPPTGRGEGHHWAIDALRLRLQALTEKNQSPLDESMTINVINQMIRLRNQEYDNLVFRQTGKEGFSPNRVPYFNSPQWRRLHMGTHINDTEHQVHSPSRGKHNPEIEHHDIPHQLPDGTTTRLGPLITAFGKRGSNEHASADHGNHVDSQHIPFWKHISPVMQAVNLHYTGDPNQGPYGNMKDAERHMSGFIRPDVQLKDTSTGQVFTMTREEGERFFMPGGRLSNRLLQQIQEHNPDYQTPAHQKAGVNLTTGGHGGFFSDKMFTPRTYTSGYDRAQALSNHLQQILPTIGPSKPRQYFDPDAEDNIYSEHSIDEKKFVEQLLVEHSKDPETSRLSKLAYMPATKHLFGREEKEDGTKQDQRAGTIGRSQATRFALGHGVDPNVLEQYIANVETTASGNYGKGAGATVNHISGAVHAVANQKEVSLKEARKMLREYEAHPENSPKADMANQGRALYNILSRAGGHENTIAEAATPNFRTAPDHSNVNYTAEPGPIMQSRFIGETAPIANQSEISEEELQRMYAQMQQQGGGSLMTSFDNYVPDINQIQKSFEMLQIKSAMKDKMVMKHVLSNHVSNSIHDIRSFSMSIGITPSDVHGILATQGDWNVVAKQWNVSPLIVKATKVTFGGM